MLILSLLSLRFQIPEIHLGQLPHLCSHAESQPSSTHYLSLTMHHWPRCCCYPSLVYTRMFHNTRPVEMRTFPKTKGYIVGSKNLNGGNVVDEDSLANTLRWSVLAGWRCFETSHQRSGLSVGISRCSYRHIISQWIAQSSISQNRSATTRSCKFWILFGASPSDLLYWLCLKI